MLKHKTTLIVCCLILVCLFLLHFIVDIKWWLFLFPFLYWILLTVWGSSDIKIGYFIKTYCYNLKIKDKIIALTFDDGPHLETEKVLDLLKKYNAKATFFCIGSNIEKYPEIFKRIIAEGHVVGNHTYTHSNRIGFFSVQEMIEEINKTNQVIAQFSGLKAKFYRPPYGITNPNIAKAITLTGHHTIGWNIRSFDTCIKDENKLFKRVSKRLKPGGIILMHDTSLKTVYVLERLLLLLQSENYELITVDRLLNLPSYEA